MSEYQKVEKDGIMDGQLDWGANGGKCHECWVVQPCCDVYCCATWYCCGCLNSPKLFSWALGQECACVNHCLVPYCCGCLFPTSLRYAIRKKIGIHAGGPMDGAVGDCLLTCCCGLCTFAQELRAAHISGGKASWDFIGEKVKPQVMVDPLTFPPFKQ